MLNTESTGSQIPLYFVAGALSFIAVNFGGGDLVAWMHIVYSIVLAAIASYSYLQDLLRRRKIILAGGVIIYAGIIIVAAAQSVC